ncbi:hypothetical protein D1872_52040 [compost metagenome]
MQKVAEPKLSWDAVVAQFENLITFAARQQVESRRVDSMLSFDDLCQEGMIKLYQCWEKWCVGHNKDMDEFGPIFRKALFRRVRQCGNKYNPTSDVEDLAERIKDENCEDVVERMYREDSLDRLQSMLSSELSKKIVCELIKPSPATLWEVWADIKRKEQLKSQGHKVNVPKDNTVRMKHIMRALNITTKQYDNAMIEIRQKVKLAFD